jgi:dTDP-4-dehydrorhamnose 3,5-epimerase
MKVSETGIPGLLIIEPQIFGDVRGFFLETWQRRRYLEHGVAGDFVQDNLSFSRRGVLRGLHFQNPCQQGKLVSVLAGEVFDVAVDIRRGSPSFGRWVGAILSGDNHKQLWLPPGFAHGFCVLSDTAYFMYKCTEFYNPAAEVGICWNDPDVGVDWPLKDVVLSEKDTKYPRLCEISPEMLPVYSPQEGLACVY